MLSTEPRRNLIIDLCRINPATLRTILLKLTT